MRAGIAKARPITQPGPAFTQDARQNPHLGVCSPRAYGKAILHDSWDTLVFRAARTPAGSTSRPGGPLQPVARRGFDMPRIGASVLRRRRFACGVKLVESVVALDEKATGAPRQAAQASATEQGLPKSGLCGLPAGPPPFTRTDSPRSNCLRRSAPRQEGRA